MADRIVESGISDIWPDPQNTTGWICRMEAFAVDGAGTAEHLYREIPVDPADTIAQWETKRRDAYRLAAGKPTAPVILITYKLAP